MIALLLSIAMHGGTPPVLMLAEKVVDAVPLDSVTVLCAADDHSWFTIDVRTGERRGWSPSWTPEDAGWIDDGFTCTMGRSPDGRHLFISRGVLLPDSFEIPDGMWGMRSAVVFVICSPDGSGAYPALTSIAVGGGPEFAFTSDSRFLVGSPVLCPGGDPAEFARYLSGEDDQVFFDRIEVETGEPSLVEGLEISDGFWKCPWSDWLRVENNWYAEHTFSNLSTGGIAGTYAVPGGEGYIKGWVLDDAVLMSPPSGQGLLYVDGTFVEAPSDGWDVYCRLDDGTYVYSRDDGRTVLHGEVDWASFEVGPSEVLAGLEGYMQFTVIPMPGSHGFLLTDFWNSETIWYCSLPGSGRETSNTGRGCLQHGILLVDGTLPRNANAGELRAVEPHHALMQRDAAFEEQRELHLIDGAPAFIVSEADTTVAVRVQQG